MNNRRSVSREAGFTLIELMIVITIILILIGMAVANYGRIVQRSKEAVLTYDLRAMREMIDERRPHVGVAAQAGDEQQRFAVASLGYVDAMATPPDDAVTHVWTPKVELAARLYQES